MGSGYNHPGEGLNLQPWLDYATVAVPDNHNAALWWAEYLWTSSSSYRMAMSRIADHFLTQVEFPDLDSDEESEFKDLFDNELEYKLAFKAAAEEFLAYGNLFVSVYQPFFRRMICRQCNYEQPIEKAKPTLQMSASAPYLNWNRSKSCPICGNNSSYLCRDRPNPDASLAKIVRWSPRDIDMAYNPISGVKIISLKPSWRYFQDMRGSAAIFHYTTPLEILESAARNLPFTFEPTSILHVSMPNLSGLHMRGWGLPSSIASFRDAWLNQMFNKADQAVAADYTLGLRLLSPQSTAGGMDPMQYEGAAKFTGAMQAAIKAHRKEPTRYVTAPVPVNYQFLGGEGASLLPPDKLKFRQGEFLNGMGVPVEFYQMNLTIQAAPMALRLFENSWQVVAALYNQLLSFVIDQVAQMLGLEAVKARMQRTTLADDAERKQVLGQLMAANQISPATFLEMYGINANDEVRRVYKHQAFTAKTQKEFDQQAADEQEMGAMSAMTSQPTPSTLAAQMQGAAAGPGGGLVGGQQAGPGAAGGGAGGGQSLPDMSSQADQMAQQLLPMPDAQRKTELKKIRESSKDMHALVMAALTRLRSDAASQGKQQVIAQMGQQAPAG